VYHSIAKKVAMGYNYPVESSELFEKKFAILQEISSAIVVTENVGSIANLMLDLAMSYTSAEKGSLMLLNEKGELYILASRGIDMTLSRSYKVKLGEGIVGTVALNREPVLVTDIGSDERFHTETRDRYRTKSFISCPIIMKNRLLGVMNINDKKDGSSFDEDELELIKIIANHAAITFENAFLLRQLKEKAADLDDINKKLIDSDILKSEFITRVSHELRTPLNSVKGAIYYILETEKISDEDKKEFQKIISSETDKLVSIVENLLDFLRVEDETRIIRRKVLSLRDVFEDVRESKSVQTVLTRSGISLKLLISDSISDIVGDRIKIVQLFINVIEGLCHFLKKGDVIALNVAENGFVDVTISASRELGEDILPYLRDSHYIFKTGRSEEFLKLYLARSIVDVHRWGIVAKNAGNQFHMTISIPKSVQTKIDAFVNESLDLFVDFVSEVLDLNLCSIMMTDELTSELTIRSSKGLNDEIIKRTRVKFGEKIAGWVALEGKPLLIEDIETDPRFGKSSISQYSTKSLLSLPVKIDDKVVGVLNLNNKEGSEPFTKIDYYIACALSERISFFIEKLSMGTYSEYEFKEFLRSFENLVNVEKKFHRHKKSLLPRLVYVMMDKMGASEEERKIAIYASTVYDLGVGLFSESMMGKKNLSASEMRSLKIHPFNTVSLLSSFEQSDEIKQAILHHHEKYDGSGYPDGLKGEEIPLLSRILAVADTDCAMLLDRPHRSAYSKEDALLEIKKGAGTSYDPNIVSILEEVVAMI